MTHDRPAVWEPAATKLLAEAGRRVRVLGCATPDNLCAELASLQRDYARGKRRAPRFTYTAIADELSGVLGRVAERLQQQGPLGRVYAERACELALEAKLCASVGQPLFWQLARQRFPAAGSDGAADALARAWLESTVQRDEVGSTVSDSEHPDSLLTRMRAAVGAARLAMRVVVRENMSALAATGAGVIYVAGGRRLTRRAVERTVLHEIRGHALPRQRAMMAPLGIFSVGTARGSEHQEGQALRLERRHGFLQGARARELALRHLAARSVERQDTFVATVDLLEQAEAPLPDALRIAARVWRGGGLAREVSYIRSMVEVDDALAREPALEVVIQRGRVAVGAAQTIAAEGCS